MVVEEAVKERICEYFLKPCYPNDADYSSELSEEEEPEDMMIIKLEPVIPFEPYELVFERDLFNGMIIESSNVKLERQKAIKISHKPHEYESFSDKTHARLMTELPTDYEAIKLVKEYPFELDMFQKQAVYCLERNESVFVAAHTSAGKTVVAEYAIALAGSHLTRAVYTSPIKALSNQKFRDLQEAFGEESVGLLTGDTQITPKDWQVMVMTTEILRSMLYRQSAAGDIRDIEFVIFDEVHYINDAERGVVWEEVIIMLPKHVKVVMLSATIPNAMEFADWVGRARQAPINVITTPKRPVPLQHWLFQTPNHLTLIVNEERKFLTDSYKMIESSGKRTALNWPDFIYFMKKRSLMPVVVFTFSRRKCQEQAEALSGIELTAGAHEQAQIYRMCDEAFRRLSLVDRKLPQIVSIREMLGRGIGIHHSGLLPIVKELVEILFSKALVRVLFATETFAMGVNMPARTVVFSSLKKHDGNALRVLTPGEYTQMAGRAGRRGRDTVGTVIIASPELPSALFLQQVILGTGSRLTSQFRLTYPMILNLLKAQAMRVEELMKRSFGENAAQRALPQNQKDLKELNQEYASLRPVECVLCMPFLESLYSEMQELGRLQYSVYNQIWNKLPKTFERGRVVLLNGGLDVAVILKKEINTLSGLVFEHDETCEYLVPFSLTARRDLSSREMLKKCKFGLHDISYILDVKLALDSEELEYVKRKLQMITEWSLMPLPMFKNLEIDEKVLRIKNFLLQENSFSCPDALEHYLRHVRISGITERLAQLQLTVQSDNLTLLPEYQARVQVLKHLGYVGGDGTVTLKGRVAAELATVDALIVCELLFENWFGAFDHAQVIALLSSMVYQDHNSNVQSNESKNNIIANETNVSIEEQQLDWYKVGTRRILEVARALEDVQRNLGVTDLSEGTPARLNFHLVRLIEHWARGVSFYDLLNETNEKGNEEELPPEGTIVRCIVRLDETCRELRGVSRLMGEWSLGEKMEKASVAIKRDICFASSLYI